MGTLSAEVSEGNRRRKQLAHLPGTLFSRAFARVRELAESLEAFWNAE